MDQRIKEDFRSLAYRVERYLRLAMTERLTVLTTCVVVAAVIFALATSAIFFLSTGLVKTLTLLTENEMLSYYIVGAGLLLIILIVYLLRKPLIENQFVKMFSRELLEGPSITERVMRKGRKEDQIRKLAESLMQELGDYDEEGGEL
ncbi:MAG: hypothetical protein J5616_03755 [Bacteroidaceae bacterium]|nr:hypothetical protein [Bacteroidaceae bacterium]